MNWGLFAASLTSAIAAVLCAFIAFRSSRSATTVEARKVDQVAYDSAVKFYTGQLDRVEKQVDRLNNQVDRLTDQLSNEQGVSALLRKRVHDLETQLRLLQETLRALRRHPVEGDTDPGLMVVS